MVPRPPYQVHLELGCALFLGVTPLLPFPGNISCLTLDPFWCGCGCICLPHFASYSSSRPLALTLLLISYWTHSCVCFYPGDRNVFVALADVATLAPLRSSLALGLTRLLLTSVLPSAFRCLTLFISSRSSCATCFLLSCEDALDFQHTLPDS